MPVFLLLIPAIPAAVAATVAAAGMVKTACAVSNAVVGVSASIEKEEAASSAFGRARQPGKAVVTPPTFVRREWAGVGPVWVTRDEDADFSSANAKALSSGKADPVLRGVLLMQPARGEYMATR